MVKLQFQELEREELEKIMEQITETPLTVLVAPMGYGKTAALKKFLSGRPDSIRLTVSMGQEEVEEDWVWKKLCIRLNSYLTEEELVNWETGIPKTRQEIDRFLESLRKLVKKPCYIVLDDFHKCRSRAVNILLERLIYEDIYGLHLILSGQVYPELPYEELQIKGYCKVINQHAMTLNRDEVKELFRINGVDLTEDELEYAYSYSAGWISAVYLLILDCQDRGRLEYSLSIYHLMKTAIFDHLPEHLKWALMTMSLLPEFELDEINYVSECQLSDLALRRLEEQIGFIQYDLQSRHYSIHTLLRSVAEEELERSGTDKRGLYQRAAVWNESEGNDIYALNYYKKAENKEAVFHLLERKKEAQMQLLESAPGIIREFFDKVEEEEAWEHPSAYFRYLYHLFLRGEDKKALERFRRAKGWFVQKAEEDPSCREILGELYILETLVRFNNLSEINFCMEQAKELRSGRPSEIFADRILTYGTPDTLTLYHRTPGKLLETIEQEKRYCRYYSWMINRQDGDWDDMIEAEFRYTVGNLKEARLLARQACAKAEARRQMCTGISGYMVLLRSDIALGDPVSFQADIGRLEEFIKGAGQQVLLQDYDQVLGYVYGLLGKLERIPGWLRDFQLDDCNYVIRSIRSGCMVYGIYLRQKKFWERLETVADEMVVPYGRTEHVYAEIYSGCFKAVAAAGKQQEPMAGVPYLERALDLAQADGIKMLFAENGEVLLPILQCMNQQDFYIRQLMEDCRSYQNSLEKFGERKNVRLTPREIELMNLVREGCRNHEISERLNIAAVTVEKTLTNVYRKLNVSNRVAAVKQMEELFGNVI